MSDVNVEVEEPPVLVEGANPFDLAKRVRGSIKCCCEGHCAEEDAVYLWLYVDRGGQATASVSGPELHDWLNAIDEAASAGVKYLVVSLESGLGGFPHLWEICEWAQSAHDMIVGLHTQCEEIAESELERVKSLRPERTRILCSQNTLRKLGHLEQEGVTLRLGQYAGEDRPKVCDKPGRLVFIDARGVLYTCGMVEGDERYRLGTIFEHRFRDLLRNPALPHAIPEHDQHAGRGCDGCPPLFASALAGE